MTAPKARLESWKARSCSLVLSVYFLSRSLTGMLGIVHIGPARNRGRLYLNLVMANYFTYLLYTAE